MSLREQIQAVSGNDQLKKILETMAERIIELESEVSMLQQDLASYKARVSRVIEHDENGVFGDNLLGVIGNNPIFHEDKPEDCPIVYDSLFGPFDAEVMNSLVKAKNVVVMVVTDNNEYFGLFHSSMSEKTTNSFVWKVKDNGSYEIETFMLKKECSTPILSTTPGAAFYVIENGLQRFSPDADSFSSEREEWGAILKNAPKGFHFTHAHQFRLRRVLIVLLGASGSS